MKERPKAIERAYNHTFKLQKNDLKNELIKLWEELDGSYKEGGLFVWSAKKHVNHHFNRWEQSKINLVKYILDQVKSGHDGLSTQFTSKVIDNKNDFDVSVSFVA
jgi:hypothetical protein